MPFRLHQQQDEHPSDNKEQQQDNLALSGPLLVSRGNGKLFVGILQVGGHPLHVVVYSVEHSSLVDDHALKVTEEVRKLNDALRDLLYLALAL